MDRIVEINLVQSDWLCWLKLKQAGVCVCVCVEHSGESRGEGERGKHGLGSNSQHGYSGSPYSALFHPPAQAAGGHDSAQKQAHLLSMTRLFRGRIPRHSSMPVVCVKGRY